VILKPAYSSTSPKDIRITGSLPKRALGNNDPAPKIPKIASNKPKQVKATAPTTKWSKFLTKNDDENEDNEEDFIFSAPDVSYEEYKEEYEEV